MYETLNWESFLALNNSLGFATVPTGAQIDSAGDTSGGNIATTVASFDGSSLNWFGTVFPGNNTINCASGPLHDHGRRPNLKTPYVTTWTFNLQHSLTPNFVFEAGLCRQSRLAI